MDVFVVLLPWLVTDVQSPASSHFDDTDCTFMLTVQKRGTIMTFYLSS